VGDGIEKTVLLFIAPDFADKENGVDHQTGDQQSEKNDAENEGNNLTPVENDPTDVEHDRQGNETYPERNEEGDSFGSARDAHDVLVYARAVSAPYRMVQSPLDIGTGAAVW
jgi:hypothetical protein